MRKGALLKLWAFLLLCGFMVYVHNYKMIKVRPEEELTNQGEVLREMDLEVEEEEPYDLQGEKVQATDMSALDKQLNFTARLDVPTRTPWKAPIMWEGIFRGELYDRAHLAANSSVALTVFAIGSYLEAYLKGFMISAEKHFMTGIPLTYYIFTDTPEEVPDFKLGPERTMKVMYAPRHSRWQDISMMRMKTISKVIDLQISYKHPYVFCLDVDSIFEARFGTEALAESVAVLHPHFFNQSKSIFSYDRNPRSKAYMKTGDYYYHAALFGGKWQNVKALVDFCYDGIMEDKKNNVEALWHDESHLNKYFWLNKPSKVLSPEYSWDMITIKERADVKLPRMIWAKKRYDVLRT
ncbi:unnamed protein product [Knipowitschia caucasica]|uniref:Uncharacterized protein n=1 Tax=Knipowitschia caucasica TaxID=637954 RepID=A0AAV2LRN3_KNICA